MLDGKNDSQLAIGTEKMSYHFQQMSRVLAEVGSHYYETAMRYLAGWL